jgi:hypothetical protein
MTMFNYRQAPRQFMAFLLRQWILVLSFSMLLFACEAQDTSLEPPPRPDGVPKEALWVGGADGGVFLVLEKTAEPQTFSAEIYFDQSGELWYKGRLKLEPGSSVDFDYKNAATFSAWDGDTLYLSDGRQLKAIDKTD